MPEKHLEHWYKIGPSYLTCYYNYLDGITHESTKVHNPKGVSEMTECNFQGLEG